MNFVVAIPTFNRVSTLKDKTLALLIRYNIPKEVITIFVGNEEEHQKYAEAINDINIVTGVVGLREQRNFISDYYPEGTLIVSVDDDLSALTTLRDGKLVPLPSLLELINSGFKECVLHNYHLWGITPVSNAFYMKQIIHTNLKFCIGHLFGYINRRIQLTCKYKHDYEFSLENSVRDGGVIRFSYVGAKTKMGEPGGINKTPAQRLTDYTNCIQILQDKYPGLVRLNKKRPGEILLSRRIIKKLVVE